MKRDATKGTELAALEAKRNEEQVRADGALIGERRAAVARVAMVVMFAMVSMTRSGPKNWSQTFVGAAYLIWAIGSLIAIRRIERPRPRNSRWVPIGLTLIDFTALTAMAVLEIRVAGTGNTGQNVVGAAIILTFSVARLTIWHVAFSLLCAEVTYLIVAIYGGTFDSHATVFVMAGYLVLGFLLMMTNRAVGTMFQDLRRRDNLTRFLPRQVAERILREGPNALAPVQREITVLFSDIRGFTGMSEGLEPREVLMMLDDYFGRMSQIVKGHDGVVGKFMGDGLLAFWGVPDHLEDHARRAVKAARDMRIAVRELNRHRATEDKPPITIGIGIHTGTVAAGMLGGLLQAEYTVIGDAVNVASRIESLTKDYAVDLLISETTWAQLGATPGAIRLASAEIRGRKEPVVLYTISE